MAVGDKDESEIESETCLKNKEFLLEKLVSLFKPHF